MLLNCENSLAAYFKLSHLLTPAQKVRLLKVSQYDLEISLKVNWIPA